MRRLGQRLFWLVDLTVHGRIYRFASSPLTIYMRDGTTVRSVSYQGGLSAVDVDTLAGSAGARISLTRGRLWTDLWRRGAVFSGARCTVRMKYDNDYYVEDARILAYGFVTNAVLARDGDTLSFTVSRDPWVSQKTIPDAEAAVSYATWNTAGYAYDSCVEGAPYPTIIGRPGSGTPLISFAYANNAGSPAYPVKLASSTSSAVAYLANFLLVAGHPVVSTTVGIYNVTDGVYCNGTVSTLADARGRTVSGVLGSTLAAASTISTSAAPTTRGMAIRAGCEYWVAWPTGGGLLSPTRPGSPLRGAGEVIRWLLEQRDTDARTDAGACEAWRGHLDPFLVDTYITDATEPEAWIQARLGMLPVHRVLGRDGDYYFVERLDATATDATSNVIDGQDCTFEDVSFDEGEIVNTLTVDYRAQREGFCGRIVYDPLNAATTSADGRLGVLTSESRRLFGTRAKTLQIDIAQETATAERIAALYLLDKTMPKMTFAARGSHNVFGHLTPGDVVRVSSLTAGDSYGLGLDDRPAIVLDVAFGLGEVSPLFRLCPDFVGWPHE